MKKVAIKYGIRMFAGFTLFFLFMHFLGLSQNYNLRIFNGIIHISMISLAIREYNRHQADEPSNYLRGVAMGLYTSTIGVISFTVFMLLFLTFNPNFMTAIQDGTPIGEYLNPVTASLFIFAEGTVIGLLGSYLVVRILEIVVKA